MATYLIEQYPQLTRIKTTTQSYTLTSKKIHRKNRNLTMNPAKAVKEGTKYVLGNTH